MIEPSLPSACYTEENWFSLEKKEIFGKLWLFAALKQQLQVNNSFVVRNFSGTPVLIQNLDGELRAFRNVCAHRGMPIQTESFGVRKMICPYHGWSYREDGGVRSIPNAKIYNICEQDKAALGLHRYALQVIGNFVFVNLSDNPLPIHEQFSSEMIQLLKAASPYFDSEVSYATFSGNYNWKLNFENVLDWNHAQFVHARTLAPLLQFEKTGEFEAADVTRSLLFREGSTLADIKFSGDVALSGNIALQDISRIGRAAMPYAPRWFSTLLDSPCDIGAFFACNIFPNTNFGSIHGEHFYLQQYVPLAPDKIEYHSWVFTSRLKQGVPSQPHLLWGIHHSEKRVIDEDMVLLSALQRALEATDTVGVMGNHEASLAAVGRWYMQHLVGEDAE